MIPLIWRHIDWRRIAVFVVPGLAGVPIPPDVEGEDLAAFILGDERAAPESVFINYVCKPSFWHGEAWRGVVTRDHTYVADTINSLVYCYDSDGKLLFVLDGENFLTEYRYDAADQEVESIQYATPVSQAVTIAHLTDEGTPATLRQIAARSWARSSLSVR